MDSTEYWRKRALEREASWHKKSQQTIERELAREYEKSAAVLKDRISILYARFAADNGMTYAAAVKLLQGQEYREWRMSMQEYLAAIDATGDNTLLRELNTLAMRSRVTRLDKLYSETLRELNRLGGSVRKGLDNFLTDAYKDNYYRGVFEIGHAGQLLSAGTHLDNAEIEKVLRNRWSGKNYSERIWKNQRKLANTLKDTMANALHRGDSLDRLSRQVEERMSVGHNDAVRLVQTELNYIQNQSALDSIRDAGMEWYEFLATLDSRTTPTCRDHDGHTYRVSEAEPGSNMPPLHPRCRSSISASLGPAEAKHGTRAARKETSGKTYYVPATMKYEDWKAVYVDQSMTRSKWEKVHTQKALQSTEQNATIGVEKKLLNATNFSEALRNGAERTNTKKMVDFINARDGADPDTIELYNSMGTIDTVSANGIEFDVGHGSGCAVQSWVRRSDGALTRVKLVIPKLSGNDLTGQLGTTLHEEMHLMDMFLRENPIKADRWFSECQKGLVDAVIDTSAEISPRMRKLFDSFSIEMDNACAELNKKAEAKFKELERKYIPNGPYSSREGYREYCNAVARVKRDLKTQKDYVSRNAAGGCVDKLQDIYDALSEGRARDTGTIRYGHGRAYYSRINNRLAETLANYGALSILRPDLIKLLKKDKPELVKALEKVVKDMLKKAGG